MVLDAALANKYLISGLPPGDSGTGRLVQALLPHARAANFQTIYPKSGSSLSDVEHSEIDAIRNSAVILLHPQTLGLGHLLTLPSRGNRVALFVLDNSFFCMQSYNSREGKEAECLDCLGSADNCHPSCKPFPVPYRKDDNLGFLAALKSIARSLFFFCQTRTQSNLLKQHFGPATATAVIGMRTEEFTEPTNGFAGNSKYDIVFHGEPLVAKGAVFALNLAAMLPEFSFLFPFEKSAMESLIGGSFVAPGNVTFHPMRWGTGLQQHVIAARLVLAPSLWSAPVEGALLKSLFYNGHVAVVETAHGFQREIPGNLLVRLDSNPVKATSTLRQALLQPCVSADGAKSWVCNYLESVNLSKIFQLPWHEDSLLTIGGENFLHQWGQ